MYLG